MKPTNDMIYLMAEERINTCTGSPENTLKKMFPDVDTHKITLKQWEYYNSLTYLCPRCGWIIESGTQKNYKGNNICEHCIKEVKEWGG